MCIRDSRLHPRAAQLREREPCHRDPSRDRYRTHAGPPSAGTLRDLPHRAAPQQRGTALGAGFDEASATFVVIFLFNLYSLGANARGVESWLGALGVLATVVAFVVGDGDPNEDPARAEPQPSLERLDQLVEQVRGSGLPVDVAVSGDPLPIPPGLDLSAYRIVQEALTNVLKHAGPGASARVELTYGAEDLEVAVTNNGTRSTHDADGGQGLIGIRERVAVAGGSVEAGPAGAGYAVRARLPYLLGTS